jgi:hypothetical protein
MRDFIFTPLKRIPLRLGPTHSGNPAHDPEGAKWAPSDKRPTPSTGSQQQAFVMIVAQRRWRVHASARRKRRFSQDGCFFAAISGV